MKETNLKEAEKILKALANEVRLKIILTILRNKKKCLCEMLPELKLSQPTLSRHFAVLRNSKVVKNKKVKNKIFYSIQDKRVLAILKSLGFKTKNNNHFSIAQSCKMGKK